MSGGAFEGGDNPLIPDPSDISTSDISGDLQNPGGSFADASRTFIETFSQAVLDRLIWANDAGIALVDGLPTFRRGGGALQEGDTFISSSGDTIFFWNNTDSVWDTIASAAASQFYQVTTTTLPTARENGDALEEGDLAYRSSDDTLHAYDGTAFVDLHENPFTQPVSVSGTEMSYTIFGTADVVSGVFKRVIYDSAIKVQRQQDAGTLSASVFIDTTNAAFDFLTPGNPFNEVITTETKISVETGDVDGTAIGIAFYNVTAVTSSRISATPEGFLAYNTAGNKTLFPFGDANAIQTRVAVFTVGTKVDRSQVQGATSETVTDDTKILTEEAIIAIIPGTNDGGVTTPVTAELDTGFDVLSVEGLNFFGILGAHSFPRGQALDIGNSGTIKSIIVTGTFVSFAGGQVTTTISYTGNTVEASDVNRSIFAPAVRENPVHRVLGSDDITVAIENNSDLIISAPNLISRNQGFSEWDETITYNAGDHVFIEVTLGVEVTGHSHRSFDALTTNTNINPLLDADTSTHWIPSELGQIQFNDNGTARYSQTAIDGTPWAEVNFVNATQVNGDLNPTIPDGHSQVVPYFTGNTFGDVDPNAPRVLASIIHGVDLRGKADVNTSAVLWVAGDIYNPGDVVYREILTNLGANPGTIQFRFFHQRTSIGSDSTTPPESNTGTWREITFSSDYSFGTGFDIGTRDGTTGLRPVTVVSDDSKADRTDITPHPVNSIVDFISNFTDVSTVSGRGQIDFRDIGLSSPSIILNQEDITEFGIGTGDIFTVGADTFTITGLFNLLVPIQFSVTTTATADPTTGATASLSRTVVNTATSLSSEGNVIPTVAADGSGIRFDVDTAGLDTNTQRAIYPGAEWFFTEGATRRSGVVGTGFAPGSIIVGTSVSSSGLNEGQYGVLEIPSENGYIVLLGGAGNATIIGNFGVTPQTYTTGFTIYPLSNVAAVGSGGGGGGTALTLGETVAGSETESSDVLQFIDSPSQYTIYGDQSAIITVGSFARIGTAAEGRPALLVTVVTVSAGDTVVTVDGLHGGDDDNDADNSSVFNVIAAVVPATIANVRAGDNITIVSTPGVTDSFIINAVASEPISTTTPQALFTSFKGADNTIGRNVDNNVTFTYHRDVEDDNYIATITSVAIVDAPVFITDAGSAITTFTVVIMGSTTVVAVKRIYTSTDVGSPTKIDIRSA